MQSRCCSVRGVRLGLFPDGQAGLCMGRCMGGAWLYDGDAVMGGYKKHF